jgi:NAD(P)-dependent dehydrogenase (short-subunit alcohol dehydrogenase family)
MRVVVLGGYGNFGARVCRSLAEEGGFEVVAAGRHPERSAADSRIQAARLDLAAPDLVAALGKLSPGILIHCAGPFQGQDYRVVAAATTVGAHYIDLADGRDFVATFAECNDAAVRAVGLLAVSGASTLPGLSSAVVDHFARCFETLEAIQIVIAPAQRAPRGAATMAGVLSYAGRPFQWLRDGNWVTAYGWQQTRSVKIDSLCSRRCAACDVPDLALFPVRYPGVKTVQFCAALEVSMQHSALWCVAMLQRGGLRLPVERWAAPLDRLASRLERFGSELGGMLVSVSGQGADGNRKCIEWHLTAPANHGPEIPCMATILLARKLARGDLPVRGAMPCMGLLTLAEFEPEFSRWGIATAIHERRM